MDVNFKEEMVNNYTENDKNNILLQLKNIEPFSKDIQFANIDTISNFIYGMELQQVANNLTINEKGMMISDFSNIILRFFDLFEIQKVELKRNYKDYIMGNNYEVAHINENVLRHHAFQKVYKKFF